MRPTTIQYQCERGLHLVTWRREQAQAGLDMVRESARLAELLATEEPVRDRVRRLAETTEVIFLTGRALLERVTEEVTGLVGL